MNIGLKAVRAAAPNASALLRQVNDQILVADLGGVADKGVGVHPAHVGEIGGVYPRGEGRHQHVVGRRLAAILQPRAIARRRPRAYVRVEHGQGVVDLDVLDVGIVLELVGGFQDGGNEAVDDAQNEVDK
jgi:hypothetical protein